MSTINKLKELPNNISKLVERKVGYIEVSRDINIKDDINIDCRKLAVDYQEYHLSFRFSNELIGFDIVKHNKFHSSDIIYFLLNTTNESYDILNGRDFLLNEKEIDNLCDSIQSLVDITDFKEGLEVELVINEAPKTKKLKI